MTKILIDEAVVRQALDALEKKYGKWGQGHDELNAAAMTALRQALEQPAPAQPDPDELTIAYMSGLHAGKKIGAKEGRNKLATWMMQCGFATGHGDTLEDLLDELDTEVEDRLAAKEWVGLTDEEIMSLVPVTGHRPATTFARAIEAKLKEKNT